jgi:spore maturation protein CgeB
MDIVFLGTTLTSNWQNVHASTYRKLIRELNSIEHQVLFLERDVPAFAANRDLPNPEFCTVGSYKTTDELKKNYAEQIKNADLVIVGSHISDGIEVSNWVVKTAKGAKAFYDLDTPQTLAQVSNGVCTYIDQDLIPKYDLYLSVAGGAVLVDLEKNFGSPMARPLYHTINPWHYHPELSEVNWDLGYSGNYNTGVSQHLNALMLKTAKEWAMGRFVVAGSGYPEPANWPDNVQHIEQLPRLELCHFYNNQRFTLNIATGGTLKNGYYPSIGLFEAAGCCTPVITNYWPGLESFFKIGEEILVSRSQKDTLKFLREICKSERKLIGERARKKVIANHTSAQRVKELMYYAEQLIMPSNSKMLA